MICEGALSTIAFLCSCMKKWICNYISTSLPFLNSLAVSGKGDKSGVAMSAELSKFLQYHNHRHLKHFEAVLFRWDISVIFWEKYLPLRRFGYLSHSCIKTPHNSVHQPMFSDIRNLTEMTKFFSVISKTLRSMTEKNQASRDQVFFLPGLFGRNFWCP